MRVAYLTTDEVNLDLAFRLAGRLSTTLDHLWPRDGLPDSRLHAVVVDWDSLAAPWRQEALLGLLADSRAGRVVLHSYGLGSEERQALRRRGVTVCRRLGRALFRKLRRVARPRPRTHAALPSGT